MFTVTVKAGLKRDRKAQKRPEKDLPKPPSRIARQLALAYLVERLIEEGKIKNYAEAARRLGVTRARMAQITNLASLSTEIQEGILLGRAQTSERRLRSHQTNGLHAVCNLVTNNVVRPSRLGIVAPTR